MNPDQAIDRVLAGLATTEAPPEMEQRVLNMLQSRATEQQSQTAALQSRAAAQQSTTSPLLSAVTPKNRHPERSAQREVEGPASRPRHPYLSNLSATSFRPWAIAAGLIIILSLTASLTVRKRHEPTHDAAVLKQHTLQPIAPTPLLTDTPSESKPHRAVVPTSRPKPNAAPEDINDLDAMAVIEMNAPSKPAPPLPLTHQEKLLATAVDHVGPEKLSILRPEVMAQQMELSKAEFHDFFDPPTQGNE